MYFCMARQHSKYTKICPNPKVPVVRHYSSADGIQRGRHYSSADGIQCGRYMYLGQIAGKDFCYFSVNL